MATTGWDNDPADYGEVVVKVHQGLIKKASLHLLRGVVLRSPVDTGRFRANWQISEGTAIQRVVSNFNEGDSGSTEGAVSKQAISQGRRKINAVVNKFPTVYLTNNLPYALRLENGWSDQAPQGMVALSLIDTKVWLDRQ